MAGCLIRKGQGPPPRPDVRRRSPTTETGAPRPLHPDDRVRRLRIGRPDELRDAEFLAAFRDRSIALDFLRPFQSDAAEMAMVRTLLSTVADSGPVHRLADHEALAKLAGCLVHRRLVVAVELGKWPQAAAFLPRPQVEARLPGRSPRRPSAPERPKPLPAAADPLIPSRESVGCDCMRIIARDGVAFITLSTRM